MTERQIFSPSAPHHHGRQAELVQPLTGSTLRRVGPIPHLGSTVELDLVLRERVSWPEGMRVEGLAPLLVGCGTERASQGSGGELTLVVWVRKS